MEICPNSAKFAKGNVFFLQWFSFCDGCRFAMVDAIYHIYQGNRPTSTMETTQKKRDYYSREITAYFGLLKKDNQNNYELVLKLLNDTTQFYDERHGCIVSLGLISECIFPRKFAYPPMIDKEMTIEGFRRLGIDSIKMDKLIEIFEERIRRKEEVMLTAAENRYFFN